MSDPREDLVARLSEAYALERAGLRLLLTASERGGREAARVYRDHGEQTREHLRLVGERLEQHGRQLPTEQSHVDVGALRVEFHFDTRQSASGLAISIYTLQSLQIALYHLLEALARSCDDEPTRQLAESILEQEEEAAELIANAMVDELAA